MSAKSTKRSNRDTSTDGHSLSYYRNSFLQEDPPGATRNRRGGGAQLPSPPSVLNVPAGTLLLFVGGSNPDSSNYAIANGSAVSRTNYPSLFSAIGVTFGSGDGVNTFNLPDLNGQTIRHSITPGIDSTYSVASHNHGGLLVATGYANSGNTADANNSVYNSINNAATSASGGSTMKTRDHDVLPLISLKDAPLPVGALLYTFRNLNVAREYCTCLPADGSAYSSSTYSDLYTVTSTSYGGTAESPNRPDFRGCFPKCNKSYSPGNNYSVDSFPLHTHGPWTGVGGNSTAISTRQDGPTGGGGVNANGTTNSVGTGNANELRGSNFSAHPIIVAENSTTTVEGLGSFSTNSLEPGDIIFYLGTTAPSKFKSLNGGDYLNATVYPDLATALETNFVSGNNIAVLSCEDRYIRGVDSGASRDPDAASRTFGGNTGNTNGANVCGTFQSESFTAHTHTFYQFTNTFGNNQYPNYGNIPYRYSTGTTLNSYGLVYNTNHSTNTGNVNVPAIKVNVCMALEI